MTPLDFALTLCAGIFLGALMAVLYCSLVLSDPKPPGGPSHTPPDAQDGFHDLDTAARAVQIEYEETK